MDTASTSGNPLVILNPAANRGHMDLYRTLMRRRVESTDAEYVETSRPREAKELAREAARGGRPIVVVGGDGSVHEVVNGILSAGRRVPLGIVAAGSGNDYALNTLKLPRDPAAAIEVAFTGRLLDVDAGRMNDKYFANSFSVGLDADIAAAAHSMKKIPFMSGERLYYASSLRQILFGYGRCPWLTLCLDTDEGIGGGQPQHYVLIAVTIGPTYGSGFRINPTADLKDGLFDICTIDYAPLMRALKLLPVVQKGEHAGLPEVSFFRARTVQIESQKPVNVELDGETSNGKSFNAKILPGALLVRVHRV